MSQGNYPSISLIYGCGDIVFLRKHCFNSFKPGVPFMGHGGSSLTNEKDHHYFLNRFVCVGEFFDG